MTNKTILKALEFYGTETQIKKTDEVCIYLFVLSLVIIIVQVLILTATRYFTL